MEVELFSLDDLGVSKPIIKKKEGIKYKCTQCHINRKKGCFRTLDNLICIGCEKKKYGKKLPKLPKKKIVGNTFSETKTTGYGGVYLITCKSNNKKYVGESSNLRRRKSNYILGNGYINPLLKKDIETLGINGFTFTVLAVMQGSTKEERLEAEAFYKAQYQPSDLYNKIVGKEDKAGYQAWKDSKTDGN